MWKATDGSVHATRQDAEDKDRTIELRRGLQALFDERNWLVSPDDIVPDMIQCAEALLEMFQKASPLHHITLVKMPHRLALYRGNKKVYDGPHISETMSLVKALCEPDDTIVIPEDTRQTLSDDLATVKEMYPCTNH